MVYCVFVFVRLVGLDGSIMVLTPILQGRSLLTSLSRPRLGCQCSVYRARMNPPGATVAAFLNCCNHYPISWPECQHISTWHVFHSRGLPIGGFGQRAQQNPFVYTGWVVLVWCPMVSSMLDERTSVGELDAALKISIQHRARNLRARNLRV